MPMIEKFNIKFAKKDVDFLIKKITEFNWLKVSNQNDWSLGTKPSILKELCDYWIGNYNWEIAQNKLNKFNHYKCLVDDIKIHLIHEKKNDNSIPLLMLHGWPGSISEFYKIIPKLMQNDEDLSLNVIAPSLPGFGFSDASSSPIGPRKMAYYINKLMTENLGYKYYYVQGGDWGSYIAGWLGFDYPKNCNGIHINMMGFRHINGVINDDEKKWEKLFEKTISPQKGYMTQKATKPITLAYSMIDNPVGVAAWIIEKFHGWADLKNNDLFETFSKDELITNIMIYLLTNSFETASWIYHGRQNEGGRILSNDAKKVEVPTACAIFPKEFLIWPPKSYVERLYNIFQWTNMPRGGHFAALEEPDLLANDVKKFIKNLKS